MNFTDPVTLDLPAEFFRVSEGSFQLVSQSSLSQGSFIKLPRAGGVAMLRWVMEVNLAVMDRDRTAEFRAFAARLGGVSACFTAFDPLLELPRGFGGGYGPDSGEVRFTHPDSGTRSFARDMKILTGTTIARVAENAPRYADTVLVDGLPASRQILKIGDVFGLGGNLYMASREAWSDATGAARLFFLWKLHKGAALGETVNFHRPRARFVLVDNNAMPLRLFDIGLGSSSIKAIEYPFVS